MSFKKKEISDDSPALADSHDGSVADPAASDSSWNSPAISKRAFLKGAATVPFAAAGAKYSVGRSRAIAPAVGVAIGAGAAAGYLMRAVQDYATGPSVDATKYENLNADELHTSVRQDAIEIAATDDTVLTTISNLLNNAQNAAFSNAKYAAIESMNLGDTEATVTTKATDEINKYYSVQQENILQHFSLQSTKVLNASSQVEANTNLNHNDVFHFKDINGSGTVDTDESADSTSELTIDFTLLNGDTFTYSIPNVTYPSGSAALLPTDIESDSGREIYVKPVSSGLQELILSAHPYKDVLQTIDSQHTTVVSEIETWITNVYSSYQSGDISLSDMVSASDIANKAPDEQGFSYAGADLALLGLEGADHAYSIELMESGEVVQGTIYAQGRTDPLELGTVYSPDSIAGTVWLAYETTDDSGNTVSDLVGLEQNFQVLDGTDSEGNSVSEVTFSSKNQQTTDTDVQKVQEELQQLQELQNELEKQQQQEVTSGGGGFVDSFAIGDLPGAATLAIIGGGVLVLFGQDDN